MNQNSNQHEENDFAFREMENREVMVGKQCSFTDLKPVIQFKTYGRNAGYVPPYRAAYMQAHGLIA